MHNMQNLTFTAVVVCCWPILWGHSGPLCHAFLLSLSSLWTSILYFHSPGVATIARHLCYSYSWLRLILVVVSTVATPGEWQCKIITGGVRRLAVANGPNIFQMLFVCCQLLDLPGIIEGAKDGKGRGKQVIAGCISCVLLCQTVNYNIQC